MRWAWILFVVGCSSRPAVLPSSCAALDGTIVALPGGVTNAVFVGDTLYFDSRDTQRISRAAPAEREMLAGRYEILSLLGSGGMAEVFAGRDRLLERMVAVKRPRRDTGVDAEISERLQREALALASIDSPHVVAIHDVGATQHGVYLVMQRLFGRTLDD